MNLADLWAKDNGRNPSVPRLLSLPYGDKIAHILKRLELKMTLKRDSYTINTGHSNNGNGSASTLPNSIVQGAMPKIPPKPPRGGSLKAFFKEVSQYTWQLITLGVLVVATSGLNLTIPKLVAGAIDDFGKGIFQLNNYLPEFVVIVVFIFIISTVQVYFSTYVSEKVAFDLRQKLAAKLSKQNYKFLNQVGTDRLLTNMTSDVDAVKTVITQGLPIVFSSVIMIVGSITLMFSINWRLALPVLMIVALMFGSFRLIFSRIAGFFKASQEVLDRLNKVINESIIASALIRVVYGQYEEVRKFTAVSEDAKRINTRIVDTFATLIPLITFFSNLAVLCVLGFGGAQVIGNTMSIGEFMAFYNYISLLVLPVVILGFVSNIIIRALASFARIEVVLHSHVARPGTYKPKAFRGEVEFRDVSLIIKEKKVLNKVNFTVKPGQKTALIGPTGAGKTSLIYLMSGLIEPTEGQVYLDGHKLETYDPDYLHEKIAVVFQDNIIFNTTIEENIAFEKEIPAAEMKKIIYSAALDNFVEERKDGLQSTISERGASLSGGQRQRLSLARALSLHPKLLLLDDFTARVDLKTEQTIVDRMAENYPDTAIFAVTQKIASVKGYDHLILLMEGELLAEGTHEELLNNSFEYQQIYSSQKTTNND